MNPYQAQGFDYAFEHAAIGMAMISLDGICLKANPALCNLLGYNLQELTARNSRTGVYLQQLEEILHWGNRISIQPEDKKRIEQKYVHASGYELNLMVTISVVLNQEGEPDFFWTQYEKSCSSIHQTEAMLLHSTHRLAEAERTFEQLLEGLPLAALITHQGIIKYVNSAGVEMIHASSVNELLGRPTSTIIDVSNYKLLEERRRKFREYEEIGSATYLIHCLDGEEKYVEGFSLVVNYEGQRSVVGIFRDITQRKMEEELIMQSEKLSTAGQLAAGIAHEIRNPLTAINGFMKLLQSTERNKEQYFSIVESELKRIEFIVNELLILSKPHVTYQNKPNDLKPLLEQVIIFMNGEASLKNVQIIQDYPPVPIFVYGETNQLKQVFINLLKNAIEASHEDGIIHATVSVQGQKAYIQVQDEGCGMPPEQIKLLGQPFYTTKESGTGLGLMISYNIIHNHGGSMTVESIPQRGTTFTVKLPIFNEEDQRDL